MSANRSVPNTIDRPHGMMTSELEVLADLVRTTKASRVLEIGMAFASSTLAILSAMGEQGRLTSIDPFQMEPESADDSPKPGYGGIGLDNVRKAGQAHRHTWIGKLDYVALPELLAAGQRFDFVFIDGYHSLDYAMLDFFYADLLLEVGGTVAFHDSGCRAVYAACQFVSGNKDYRRVGPEPVLVYQSSWKRAARRAYWFATGQHGRHRERRERWKSLAVFQKNSGAIPEQFALKGM